MASEPSKEQEGEMEKEKDDENKPKEADTKVVEGETKLENEQQLEEMLETLLEEDGASGDTAEPSAKEAEEKIQEELKNIQKLVRLQQILLLGNGASQMVLPPPEHPPKLRGEKVKMYLMGGHRSAEGVTNSQVSIEATRANNLAKDLYPHLLLLHRMELESADLQTRIDKTSAIRDRLWLEAIADDAGDPASHQSLLKWWVRQMEEYERKWKEQQPSSGKKKGSGDRKAGGGTEDVDMLCGCVTYEEEMIGDGVGVHFLAFTTVRHGVQLTVRIIYTLGSSWAVEISGWALTGCAKGVRAAVRLRLPVDLMIRQAFWDPLDVQILSEPPAAVTGPCSDSDV